MFIRAAVWLRIGKLSFMQSVEKVPFLTRIFFATFYTVLRYGHYFSKFGKNTWFQGLPEFDPSFSGRLFVDVSDNVFFSPRIRLSGSGILRIGCNTSINYDTLFQMTCDITIGENVMIADGVIFRTADHAHADTNIPMKDQGRIDGTITVEDNVWIAGNVTVLRGVTIGHNSIIGAGAVVTRSIPPFSLAAGVPAKIIRSRVGPARRKKR